MRFAPTRVRRMLWPILCLGAGALFLLPTTNAATGIDAQDQVLQWSAKTEPKPVQGLPAIGRLANGPGFSLALDKQGRIWVWGNNDSGQLGLNHFRRVDQPTQLMLPQKMIAIAAGARHALAIDDQGQIWSWGANNQGQLGEGLASPFDVVRQPKRIRSGFTATDIAAGGDFSAALDRDGGVWVWGMTPPGKMSAPQQLRLPGQIRTIAASGGQLAASDSSGGVWVWSPPAQPAKAKQLPTWLANNTRGDTVPVISKPAPAPVAAQTTPAPPSTAPGIVDKKLLTAAAMPPVKPGSEAIKNTSPKAAEPLKKGQFKLVGRIRSGTSDLSGVHIRGSGINCSDSDESGRYSCQANAGWSGTLTPSKPGYRFSPSSVTVPAVQDDDPDVQTFRAIYEPQ